MKYTIKEKLEMAKEPVHCLLPDMDGTLFPN